ncbi:hypothetical protein SLEP1_g29998 [Rubroshorea leprosula]|uniref:Uncharacterized protein n=1 Tax=Rubroshorea leprosula TaxID=152421 RepID=A0AAV5JYN6_9ROSI|nr:hypothetical protein SLEP1_g29998 [Rubroshorea leprosula]
MLISFMDIADGVRGLALNGIEMGFEFFFDILGFEFENHTLLACTGMEFRSYRTNKLLKGYSCLIGSNINQVTSLLVDDGTIMLAYDDSFVGLEHSGIKYGGVKVLG